MDHDWAGILLNLGGVAGTLRDRSDDPPGRRTGYGGRMGGCGRSPLVDEPA
ncbi:hypothetical protein ACFCV3_11835 [Kribbella sp. NPDC056345]|uniref:hypothetical protein n=1 Tax=Kribbella sp. NPDC056345 TaxID=3345789 RepID=UPI0035D91E2F